MWQNISKLHTLVWTLCSGLFPHVCTNECEGVVKQWFPASQSVSRETRRARSAISPLCGLTLLCCSEWKGFRGYAPLQAAYSDFSVQSHHTTASYNYMGPTWACAVVIIMKISREWANYAFPQPLFYIWNLLLCVQCDFSLFCIPQTIVKWRNIKKRTKYKHNSATAAQSKH